MAKITGTPVTLKAQDIIIPDGQNARQVSGLDKASLFGLEQSMEDLGQLNPIHVNCIGGKEIHLIAGERRLRAALHAGDMFVQCTRHDDLDAKTVWQIQMTENDPRYRVNLNCIEEAAGYQRGNDLGMSVKQIAANVGVSEDTIAKRLRLLKLNPEVQRMVTREKFPIPIHQALLLTDPSLTEGDQIALARKIAPLTGPIAGEKEAREMIDQLKGDPLPFEDEPEDTKNHRKDTDMPRQSHTRGKMEQTKTNPAAGSDSKKTQPGAAVPQVKPMDAKVGISGKIGLTEANVVLTKATLSLNIDGKIKTIFIAQLMLDLPDDSFKELGKAIKAAAKKNEPAEDAKPKAAEKKYSKK